MSERVTHIGSYRIERELARDERRSVYMAWQMSLNRPVQISQLTLEAAADTEFVNRWKLAARDLRDPGHPQLPRILDAQFSGEQPYLVESYIVADQLADRLDGKRDLNEAVRIIAGIADALGYAHRRGWSHGSVSPESVRVIDDGSAYLLDLPWAAAQRAKGDLVAMQADVHAVVGLMTVLREPRAGKRPALTGASEADTMAMVVWLSRNEPADSVNVASALAPVLVQASSGAITNCYQLAEQLQPIAPRAHTVEAAVPPIAGTLVTPPPGTPGVPYTPPPAAPQPQVAPPPPPPPQVYATPPPIYSPTPRSSGRGLAVVAGVSVVLLVLLAAGYLLCQTGVLPFCVSCDEGLIAQYTSGARVYLAREAWGDAQRELQAAAGECAACGAQSVAACADSQVLLDEVTCRLNVDALTTEGQELLDNEDVCTAAAKLEEAIAQSSACDADPSVARSYLARNSDGGAYTACAQELLAQAEGEPEAAIGTDLCGTALDMLTKAHDIRPASAIISQLYLRADSFARLQAAHAAADWDAAEEARRELERTTAANDYCGVKLDDLRFDILIGQGNDLADSGDAKAALEKFEAAEPLAHSLAQENTVAQAIASLPVSVMTPTPTPTRVATATPATTATPFVTTQGANIRACPSTECAVLQNDSSGARFSAQCYVTQGNARWYKLKVGSGEGWVHNSVVSVQGNPRACRAGEVTPTPAVASSSSQPSQPSQPSGGACRPKDSLPPVTLLSPPKDKTCNGPVRFLWQAPYELQAGETFEIRIWPDRQQNKDGVTSVRDTSAVVDLRTDVRWINWLDDNRAHFWEVVVVCKATGTQVSLGPPNALLFYFETRLPVDENNPDNNCR